jgi:hypothetical protein
MMRMFIFAFRLLSTAVHVKTDNTFILPETLDFIERFVTAINTDDFEKLT